MFFFNLVTPKAAAKHEPLFNKPASEADLVSFSHYLAEQQSVIKFMAILFKNLVTPKAAAETDPSLLNI